MTNTTTAETITTRQIVALRDESLAAGHPGAGERAIILRGWQALEYAVEYPAVEYPATQISKYADPTDGARVLTLVEAEEIAKVDPGLIWILVDVTAERRDDARESCDAINAL